MPSGARTAWPSFSLLPTIVMSVHPSPLVRLLVSFYDIARRKSRFWHLSGLPKAFHALAAGGQDREQASLRPLDLWCRRAHVSSRSSHSHWIRHRRRSSGPAMEQGQDEQNHLEQCEQVHLSHHNRSRTKQPLPHCEEQDGLKTFMRNVQLISNCVSLPFSPLYK